MADHYYIAPFVGTGTAEDPFRPKGADEGGSWGAVDLRVDSTVTSGWCVATYETRRSDETNMRYLGATLDGALTAGSAAWVRNNLGVDVTGLTVRQSITRVVKDKVNVRPDPDGKKRIRLRGVVHEE